MYGCDYSDTGSSLYAIDSTTGETTLIGPMYVYGCLGLTFSNNGDLIAYGYASNESLGIFNVDVSTGAATLIAIVSSPTGCPNYELLGFASNPSDGTLYATFSNCLVTIDPRTGAATEIGTPDYGTYYGSALAFGPSNILYSAGGYPSLTLYTLDPTTASTTHGVVLAGSPSSGCSMEAMTFNEGELYGVLHCSGNSEYYFVSIDTSTGAMTVIGQPSEGLVAIAAGPYCNLSSGTCSATYTPTPPTLVYGCATPEDTSFLYAIDPTTGEATLIGSMGMNWCSGLVFSANGTLYAFGEGEDGNPALFTVNVATGAATLLGESLTPRQSAVYDCNSDLGLALSPTDGTLYAAIDNCIVTLAPSNGTATIIGQTEYIDYYDYGSALAFSPSNTLYAASDGLYTVSPETAADSQVAQFSGYPSGCNDSDSEVSGLSFNGNTLYGVLECAVGNYLVTVNTTTAAMTVIGQTLDDLYAIAWLPNCALSTSSCSTIPTPTPTTITAYYQGDSNYAPSSGSFVLNSVISPVTVFCSPLSVGASEATTCTASVKGNSPSGTMTFSSSSSSGSFVPSNGVCTLSSGSCYATYSDTTAGSVNITAKYGGDSHNNPSSGSFIVTILVVATTSTGIICSPSPVTAGSPTKCTATVTGSSPSGVVSWSSSGSGSFDSYSCTLSTGTCSVDYTPATSKSPVNITVSYKGDSKNGQSTGAFSLAVSKITTTMSLSCSPSSVEIDAPTTCTASYISSIAPTGTVSFTTSSSNGGAVTPSSSSCTLSGGACSVTFKGSLNHAGAVTVTATYPGDSNSLGSSNTFSLSIDKNPTTTDVSCVPSLLNPTKSTTCTAAVSSSFNLPGYNGPYAAAYDPENGYVYVANEGNGYAQGWGDTVSVIDGASGTLVTTVYAGYAPDGVAYDSKNGLIYVSDGGSGSGNTVALINASTNTLVQFVTVGNAPYGIAYDSANGYIYVANYWDDSVSVINGNVSLGFIPLLCAGFERQGSYCGPAGVAYDSKNGYIYVANQLSYPGTISVIDGSNNSLIATIDWYGTALGSGTNAITVDPDNGFIYAAAANGDIYVISPASTSDNTIVQYVPTSLTGGEYYDGIAFDSNNGNIYAASQDGYVAVIDGRTNAQAGEVEAALGASGTAIDNSNGYIFVADWLNNTVAMIEPAASAQGETITFSQSGGTGSVSFGSTTCALSSEGACSVSITALTIGSVTIEASYGGDSNYGPSSGTFSLTIASKTSTSVVCTPSPVYSGSPTTCTATVTGTSPTGTVSWSTSGRGAFSTNSCTLSSSGSCSVSYTPSSSTSPVTITGAYNGDANNFASSGIFSLKVNPTTTTTTTTTSGSGSCGCSDEKSYTDPAVSNPSDHPAVGTYPSPDKSTNASITSISGSLYLAVTKGSNTIIPPQLNPVAWGWSPNGRYFVLAIHPSSWDSNKVQMYVYDLDGSSPSTPTIQETMDLGTVAEGSPDNTASYGTVSWSWGFSPNSALFALFYDDVDYSNVQVHLWVASSGQYLVTTSSPTTPLPTIQFSPCSDLFMVSDQTASFGSNLGTVNFYETWAASSVYESVSIIGTPFSASTDKDASGNYIVELTGMSLSSFASPQCTQGATTTTTTTTTTSTSSESGTIPTKVTVKCDDSTLDQDSNTFCTATVTETSGGGSYPPGSIDWYATDGEIGDSCVLSSGSCSVMYTASGNSPQVTITANYNATEGSNFENSQGTFQITVNLPNSSHTVINCTLNSDNTFTCAATVTGSNPSVPPSGDVNWYTDPEGQGDFSPNPCVLFADTPPDGSASCPVIFTPSVSGQITITGEYQGDTHNSASSGSTTIAAIAVTETTTESNKAPTETYISCTPTDPDSSTECTVTVNGGNNPTGDITFDWNELIGGLPTILPTCQAPSCMFTISDVGTTNSTIMANYMGDSNNAPSSAGWNLNVGATSTESGSETTSSESGNPCDAPDSGCDVNEVTDPAYVLLTDPTTGFQAGCNATGIVVDTIPGATVANTNPSALTPCSGGTEKTTIPSPIASYYDIQIFSVGSSSSFTITFTLADSHGNQLGATNYFGSVVQGAPLSMGLMVGSVGSLSISSSVGSAVPEFPQFAGLGIFVVLGLLYLLLVSRRAVFDGKSRLKN